jgi:hypothetical protein
MLPAGMSRSSFSKAIHEPGFPEPIQLVSGGDEVVDRFVSFDDATVGGLL